MHSHCHGLRCSSLPSPAARGHWLVGFSGGADSTALLLLTLWSALRQGTQSNPPEEIKLPVSIDWQRFADHLSDSDRGRIAKIKAVHVHHALHSESDQWAEHCQMVAQKLGVNFEIRKVNNLHGGNFEEKARLKRQLEFKKVMQKGDILLLGHHLDDQAETILLRLLRGAGPHGLSAMTELGKFGSGHVVRPLLHLRSTTIAQWLKRQQLGQQPFPWIDAADNQDVRYDRNYLRHRIVPRLEERWPQAPRLIARSAQLVAEELGHLADHPDADAKAGNNRSLIGLQLLIRAECIRHAIRPPPIKRLREFCRQLMVEAAASSGAQPQIQWHIKQPEGAVHCQLRWRQGVLWLDKSNPHSHSSKVDVPIAHCYRLCVTLNPSEAQPSPQFWD